MHVLLFSKTKFERKFYICTNHVKIGGIIMARPIKATPVLEGKDAERFLRLMNEPRPISKEERERMIKNYEFCMSIATFKW